MTRNRSRYLPTRSPAPPPVVPGLGPDSLAGLTPAAADARAAAAAEREESADRHAAARRLADRVEAAAPPVPRSAAPTPTATPNGAQRPTLAPPAPAPGAAAPSRRPWREGPLVVSTRRAAESVPEFTPDDLAALGRLLSRERTRSHAVSRATGSTPPATARKGTRLRF